MASTRLRQLALRLTSLKAHLLPPFSPTGAYSDEDIDSARAYRLLVHAEIEAYFEDRARDIVINNIARWKADRKPRVVIQSLLSCHVEQRSVTRVFNDNAGRADRLECAVDAAASSYFHIILTNHGIKEDNVLKILEPLGIVDIDRAWLLTMESFGGDRGKTAHSAIATYQPVDPYAEWETVKAILKGIRRIDRDMDGIS